MILGVRERFRLRPGVAGSMRISCKSQHHTSSRLLGADRPVLYMGLAHSSLLLHMALYSLHPTWPCGSSTQQQSPEPAERGEDDDSLHSFIPKTTELSVLNSATNSNKRKFWLPHPLTVSSIKHVCRALTRYRSELWKYCRKRMQVWGPSSQFMTSKQSSFSNCLGIASVSLNRMVIRHKPPNHTFHHSADQEREAQEGVCPALGSHATRDITFACAPATWGSNHEFSGT